MQVEWQEFATYLEYMLYVESVAAWCPPTRLLQMLIRIMFARECERARVCT